MEAAHHLLEPVDHVKPFWRLVEAFRAGGSTEPALLDSADAVSYTHLTLPTSDLV